LTVFEIAESTYGATAATTFMCAVAEISSAVTNEAGMLATSPPCSRNSRQAWSST
jgi:hypothetical protein